MEITELHNYLKRKFRSTSSFLSGLSLFFVDAIVLLFSLCLGFFIVNIFAPEAINFKSVINYAVFVPFILILFIFVGLYPGIMIPPTEEIKKFCGCTFISFAAIYIALLFSNYSSNKILSSFIVKDTRSFPLIIAFCIAFPFATILLPGFRQVARNKFAKYKWWGVPAVVYSTNESANYIIERLLKNPSLGYHPAIIIDSECKKNTTFKDIPVFGPEDDVLKEIRKLNIKQAVICDYKGEMSSIMSNYRYTITISKNQTNFTNTQQLKDIAGILGFASIHNLTFKINLIIKRLLDIFIILFFSPLWIPVMLILAFLTKITSKGPVFYGHKRVGKNGKEIKCLKFRSMCINSQEILEHILATDPAMKAEWEKDRKFINDPRITKFGKFLRKTSLDELPQLFNVLIGDMSLVGPRPVTEPELVKYGKYKDYVLSVLPGLSGMWQVSGRSDTGYEERISFDTYYIQNWSIWLDIWILIKTVWVVLKGKGAY